ncbi:hypothetical protein BH11ARM2_BH11ARM2_01020 [soil metagenome]
MLPFLLILASPSVETFQVGGVQRQALVYRGTGTEPMAGRPLVLAFHGHGGSMRQAARSFDVQTNWPEATVVYPDGLPTPGMTDPEGQRKGWQQKPGEQKDRDLAFTDAILSRMKGYDPKRVYAMGHSNGGRFTYVLWAERGSVFAAYGISGSPVIGLFRQLKPASAFITAGEKDPIVPYRSQEWSIDAVRRLLGADPSRAKKDGYLSLEPAKDGLELGTYIFPRGHEFPAEAARATVELFKRHNL